jgi:hypothetical protein
MAFKQRESNDKTKMTKPGLPGNPSSAGKQLPNGHNRGVNVASDPPKAGTAHSGWHGFKRWGSIKGPGNNS